MRDRLILDFVASVIAEISAATRFLLSSLIVTIDDNMLLRFQDHKSATTKKEEKTEVGGRFLFPVREFWRGSYGCLLIRAASRCFRYLKFLCNGRKRSTGVPKLDYVARVQVFLGASDSLAGFRLVPFRRPRAGGKSSECSVGVSQLPLVVFREFVSLPLPRLNLFYDSTRVCDRVSGDAGRIESGPFKKIGYSLAHGLCGRTGKRRDLLSLLP
jgi:hypothetical protein